MTGAVGLGRIRGVETMFQNISYKNTCFNKISIHNTRVVVI